MKEYLEKSSKILDELQTTEQGLSEAELRGGFPNTDLPAGAGKKRAICSGFSKS